MQSSRQPRFKRVTPSTPIEITARDVAIVQQLHRHRFLRSHYICALMGGSRQQVLRRLQLLYHHGYVERPRAQLTYYHRGGSRSIVYGLGNKGALLLEQKLGVKIRKISWGEKNRAIGRMFLEHALLVSDVMVTLELACRANEQVRLLYGEEIELPESTRKQSQPFRWSVKLDNGKRLGLVPDGIFALVNLRTQSRSYFFLEADRCTMPAMRRNLTQTSFYRKLLAYEATWTRGIHTTRFGFPRFRVLTITQSASRVESLVEACSGLKRAHGLFLFAAKSILDHPEGILSAALQTGRVNETSKLLNQPEFGCPKHFGGYCNW